MTDEFSRPYGGVPYFGIWASETMEDYGRNAWNMLANAVECCADEDMHQNRLEE